MPNINTLLDEHVSLSYDCIDRMYLNGYMPKLQTPASLVTFYHDHRGKAVVSPALFRLDSQAFVTSIESFAESNHIPVVHFEKGQCKEDIARRYFERFRGLEGVVMIGIAQERTWAFKGGSPQRGPNDSVHFHISRQSVFVNQYYFYLFDQDFGPSFIKFNSYVPFSIKVWLNGHQWVKRQLTRQKIAFRALDNGLLSVADPSRLQALCDSLRAEHVDAYFRKWLAKLPHPFTAKDRDAGYRYALSFVQLEVSSTQVFKHPSYGRQFFEEVVRENLNLGRPEEVQLVFGRRVQTNTPGRFRSRIITPGVDPSLYIYYKNSKLKQYFKEGKALRTELTFNDTRDFGVRKALKNFDYLRDIGKNVNRRLLGVQRLSHACAVPQNTFHQMVLPSEHDGQRAPALRYGDPRVMALLSALCAFIHLVDGFSNQTLRRQMAKLLDADPKDYSPGRMTYDLRRLRLKGLIRKIPNTNRYMVTPKGRLIALFFSKTYTRILQPGLAQLEAPPPITAPASLRLAWNQFDKVLNDLIDHAQLKRN